MQILQTHPSSPSKFGSAGMAKKFTKKRDARKVVALLLK